MFDTPNLAKEFHPVPKVFKGKEPKKSTLGPGKKTTQWEGERAKLIEEFANMDITSCEIKFEGCWKNNALGFAHIDKRKNLRPEDLPSVVLACTPCHQTVEAWNNIRMRKFLLEIIKKRNESL